MCAHHEYDAFGNLTRIDSGNGGWSIAATNPFRFSTKWHDLTNSQEEWGTLPLVHSLAPAKLYYYGYRFYAPEHGRWINRDPIGEEGGVLLYGFVNQNPVNYFDSDGRLAWPLGPFIFGFVVDVGVQMLSGKSLCEVDLNSAITSGGAQIIGGSLFKQAKNLAKASEKLAEKTARGARRTTASSRDKAGRTTAKATEEVERIKEKLSQQIRIAMVVQAVKMHCQLIDDIGRQEHSGSGYQEGMHFFSFSLFDNFPGMTPDYPIDPIYPEDWHPPYCRQMSDNI
jgi:RHS repeat-associated protein